MRQLWLVEFGLDNILVYSSCYNVGKWFALLFSWLRFIISGRNWPVPTNWLQWMIHYRFLSANQLAQLKAKKLVRQLKVVSNRTLHVGCAIPPVVGPAAVACRLSSNRTRTFFEKYSEPEQNRTLVIKEPERNRIQNFGFFPICDVHYRSVRICFGKGN